MNGLDYESPRRTMGTCHLVLTGELFFLLVSVIVVVHCLIHDGCS